MKYFNYEEFDSPDIQGSGQLMDPELLDMIDKAREIYGKPIRVTSGYRTEDHNRKVGGVDSSSHLKGLAIDVACVRSRDRFEMLTALIEVGFNRVGVASTFIH
ncbi:MAG: peptidase M15, partial [Aliivibrio sp.]|nr:peptidase M15 [Aliivibrio sp.]